MVLRIVVALFVLCFLSLLYRRVQGVLSISRSFGDRALRPFVIAEPDIQVHNLEEGDDYLIMASDGIFLHDIIVY